MSKLSPIVKQQLTPINRLINFINEVKPYHTKVLETAVKFTIYEDVFVTITDTINTTVDLLLDNQIKYNDTNIIANIGLMEQHGYNLYGYGFERFAAKPGLDTANQIDPNGENTINTSMAEYLIIDKTRTLFIGLDYSSQNEFDSNGKIILPAIKVSPGPIAVGTFTPTTFSAMLTSVIDSPNLSNTAQLSTPVANVGSGGGTLSEFFGNMSGTTVNIDSTFNQL
jgi:hypothetical protein